MRIGNSRLIVLAGLAVGVLIVSPPGAFGQVPFYQGKTLTIIQAREAGGTGDLRVRAQVPFLRKYIPGNPTISLEFVPGGAGR
jgi:tripartite-type tricarboxylate transporter receptor subunit TctC